MLLTNLAETLGSLHGNKDGQLTLYNHDAVLTFYVVKGQLLYVKDEHHPVRRWDRALKQYGCNWNWAIEPSHLLGDRSWECHLLDEGINQEKLSLLRAKLLIRTVAQECLFELNNQKDFESDWKPSQKMASRSWQPIALSSWEMQTISSRAMKMQQEWQTARLGHLSPSLSPILRQGAYHQALPILEKYLNGNFTLWDIAWLLKNQ
ncbi:MAG: hypothetical protein HC769_15565 [Cyanobacteria bacterium CRU_2_1]|nr:hypothetical protein [Cyanobacteria bacterium CRU_2_1]